MSQLAKIESIFNKAVIRSDKITQVQDGHVELLPGSTDLSVTKELDSIGIHTRQIVRSQSLTGEFSRVVGLEAFDAQTIDVHDLQQLIGYGVFLADFDGESGSGFRYTNEGVFVRLLQASPGDANGDGQFESKDLIRVFQGGQYEDDVAGSSNWYTGDWNHDGDFDSGDLLLAFQAGRYEQPIAAKPIANAANVPARKVGGAFHVDERTSDANKARKLAQPDGEIVRKIGSIRT